MKKCFKLAILCFCLVAGIICVKTNSVEAKQTVLKEGKSFSYDLDGDGKKEKIRFEIDKETKVSEYDYSYTYTVISGFYIYINNRKSYSETWVDSFYPPGKFEVEIFDHNPADKSKEIKVVIDYGIDEYYEYYLFGYSDKELSLMFKDSRIKGISSKQQKDDKIKCEREVRCALGFPIVYSDYKMKNGELEEANISNATLKASTSHWFGKKFVYSADVDISLYNKIKSGKVVYTIKKGESFQMTKIKMVNGEAKYAYIKLTESKKSGWINVEGDIWSHPIVTEPAFNNI